MNYLRRLEPTPIALRNGRLVMAMTAVILTLVGLMLLVTGGIGDPGTLAILAATGVTVAGHAIAYVGQPTLTRYRIGLVVITVGVVGAFAFLLLDPSAPAS